MRRHTVQHKACTGDDAVGAFFLYTGQAGQELVGDVLAQAYFAEGAARDHQLFAADHGFAVVLQAGDAEGGGGDIVDLAVVVADAFYEHPVAVRVDHFPAGQVVQRGAPEHGFFTASIHGDIAANTGRFGRGGVYGKHQAGCTGRFGHAGGDHTGTALDGGALAVQAGQLDEFHAQVTVHFFGIDHRAAAVQRHGATGVAGTTATRDDGELQLDTGFHQRGDFGFGVRAQHHEGVLYAPVGGVGHVRYAGQAVEQDVVAAGDLAQALEDGGAQRAGFAKLLLEGIHRGVGGGNHAANLVVAVAAFFYFTQAVAQRLYQRAKALRVVQQVVYQVGVAVYHPDITQYLEKHTGRAACFPLCPQFFKQLPHGCAQ